MAMTVTIVSSHIVEIVRAPIKGNQKLELDCLANQVFTFANSYVTDVRSLGLQELLGKSRQLQEQFK